MTGKIPIKYDSSNVKVRRKIAPHLLSGAARGVFRFESLQVAMKDSPRLTPIVWNQRRMRRGVGHEHRLRCFDVAGRLHDLGSGRLRRRSCREWIRWMNIWRIVHAIIVVHAVVPGQPQPARRSGHWKSDESHVVNTWWM